MSRYHRCGGISGSRGVGLINNNRSWRKSSNEGFVVMIGNEKYSQIGWIQLTTFTNYERWVYWLVLKLGIKQVDSSDKG